MMLQLPLLLLLLVVPRTFRRRRRRFGAHPQAELGSTGTVPKHKSGVWLLLRGTLLRSLAHSPGNRS
uniref:Putative secreted protein n=1 Tax=Anopheles darlingi TaxID=43151 RepID=A0A2M4DDK2_ANODA